MGSLRLDAKLKPGEYRPLTTEEIEELSRFLRYDGKDECYAERDRSGNF